MNYHYATAMNDHMATVIAQLSRAVTLAQIKADPEDWPAIKRSLGMLYQDSLSVTCGPVAQPDGHDTPRSIDELVPGKSAVVDDVVVGSEHAVGQPIFAHKLPDILDWV